MRKKPIAACCGAFDGEIHPGHINFLKTSASYDILYVFVVPDDVIRRNKNREPIFSQGKRMEHVETLGIAHKVVALVGSDSDQLRQITKLQPDVFCFGEDQSRQFDVELRNALRIYGTKFVTILRFKPELYSTTKLINSSSTPTGTPR